MNALNIKTWIRSIDLMTLRLFASIVEESNIARAAARESIAASAVTKRMHDLEETFGYKLLYRDPKGTTLTPVGEMVYRDVRAMLDKLGELHHTLSSLSDGVQGHVRVWATEAVLVEYLAEDIAAFLRAYPLVTFDIQEADSIDVFRALAIGTADVGVCAEPLEPPARLAATPYRTDRLVALMTRLHPLAGREQLSFEELLELDLIGWTEQTGLMRRLRRAAEQLGREFRPKYRVASSHGARSLVRAGLGVAIHPEGTIWPYEDAEHMCSAPLTDAWARRQLSIYLDPARTVSVATRTLVQSLTEAIEPARAAQ
jgi:DNA-binding transcriptional LysR family regulator